MKIRKLLIALAALVFTMSACSSLGKNVSVTGNASMTTFKKI
jgi:hypothetical protein